MKRKKRNKEEMKQKSDAQIQVVYVQNTQQYIFQLFLPFIYSSQKQKYENGEENDDEISIFHSTFRTAAFCVQQY